MIDHRRDDLDFLPSDCELPALPAIRSAGCVPLTEALCRGRREGNTLYTINSNRSRYQIVRDYARRHNLTVGEIDALVRGLPDYGLQSQLAASVAALNVSAEIIELAEVRAARRGRK